MQNKKHVTIIGGGIAGLETAAVLSNFNHKVTIIEKLDQTGGKLNNWSALFPDNSNPEKVIQEVCSNHKTENLNIIHNTEVAGIKEVKNGFEVTDGKNIKVYSDAVVLASGFSVFDANLKEEYGYGIYANVITSADFEKAIKEHKTILTRQSNNPKRVAIIHCVGSRDAKVGNIYCSKVCCITGVKQALEINKLIPDCEVYCFYMDLRLYGSNFDSLYLEAQKHHNIQFIRGRLSEVSEKQDLSLQIKAEDTLSGRPLRMNVDMVILLVGMEPDCKTKEIVSDNSLLLDENGFYKPMDYHVHRNGTNHKGIFVAGSCICPMSVSDTIEHARSAAFAVNNYLNATIHE